MGDFYFLLKDTPTANPEVKPIKIQPSSSQPTKDILPFEPQMVFVKGGTYIMGNTSGEPDERPFHQINLPDYFIGKLEITQAEWRAVLGKQPSFFNQCDLCPVEQVSWNEVQEYLIELNKLSNKQYRLPTEEEWEFAAKGGSSSKGYIYMQDQIILRM